MGNSMSRIIALALLCASAFAGCSSAPPKSELDASVSAAQNVLARFEADPVNAELRDRLRDAKAVLIVSPGMARGVVLARRNGQGWSGPAFYYVTRLEAAGGGTGGAGFTAGKQDLEMIAVAMTDKAMAWFMSPRLPGESGLALLSMPNTSGGGGRPADMVLFNRTETGKRAATFDNTTLVSIDRAGNQTYYGRDATPSDILVTQSVTSPSPGAVSLQKAMAAAAR